jgi:hypothetical protein
VGSIRHHELPPLFFQYLVVAYAGNRLAVLFLSGRRHYLQIVFWFFAYVWMGLAPLAQLASDQYPQPILFADAVVEMASLVVLAGLLAYDVGSVISRRWLGGASAIIPWLSGREVCAKRVTLLGLFVLLATPILVQQMGGLEVQFTSREAETEALIQAGLLTEGSKAAAGLSKAFATIPAFIGLYGSLMIRQEQRSRRVSMTLGLFVMLVLLLLVNVIVNNPISNPRFWFGTVAISLALLGRFSSRPHAMRLLVVGLVIGGIIVFPYADYFRYTDSHYQSLAGIAETLVTKADYDAMQMTQASVDYSDRIGHTNGRQVIGALFFWYPRAWWPAKPRDTGVMLGIYHNSINTNLSSPLWGEMYLDFGLLGVLTIFLALGWVSGGADRLLNENLALGGPNSLLRLAIPIMAGYQIIILRGSLLQSLGRAAVIGIVVLLITRNRKYESRRDASGVEKSPSPRSSE